MATKIAINGFGRIGRLVFRGAMNNPELDIVAVNGGSWPAETLAHLLKYDTVHGTLDADIKGANGELIVNGKHIKVLGERNPEKLPWREMGVQVVAESTGKLKDRDKAMGHLTAGAKKVVITSPAKGEDITIVMGVNDEQYDPRNHHIISNASCTTNCLAPFAKVLNDSFGIKRGLMTTVHAFTNDQMILDKPHKDLRRARAAMSSIIPTTTGAAKAVALVLPELKGKLNGFAMRVPTPNVSVVDLTCDLEKSATAEEINAAFRAAANGRLKGILGVCDEELVSKDFNGDSRSSIIDAPSTMVIDGNMAKVVAWYDNEWGYSLRVVDLMLYVISKGL